MQKNASMTDEARTIRQDGKSPTAGVVQVGQVNPSNGANETSELSLAAWPVFDFYLEHLYSLAVQQFEFL
jgi:hypothetical protein